ncbi:hypothetical protein BJX64DRAFT_271300 [Aspergillus heterothallicus]
MDINFVLSEGELLFCEVSDDFPKTADLEQGDGESKNKEASEGKVHQQQPSFVELGNVLPWGLPPTEIQILRESLHQSLVKLGLTMGIFHLEARVQNSSVEDGVVLRSSSSKPIETSPIIDLIPRLTPLQIPASA